MKFLSFEKSSSFLQCYSHYFPRLIDDKYGVPLEHYITCVKNVEIVADQGVIKRIQTTITPSFSIPLNHSKEQMTMNRVGDFDL